MKFDLKSLLDRELFGELVSKHHLGLKLISFMAGADPGEPPDQIWLLLESVDFAADVLGLLQIPGVYLDHYRHPMPVGESKSALFGSDGVPVVNIIDGRGIATARLSVVVKRPREAPDRNVELIIEVRAQGEPQTLLGNVRSFYDRLSSEHSVLPADIGKKFARPALPTATSPA
jgi:hypothetical protein